MKAREIMTSDVVSVRPDDPRGAIAKLLIEKGISAVPVVDAEGAPVGMVSEGDLIGRDDSDREARRDWWLALLAEGEELNPEFLASLRAPERTARDLMSRPIITVGEETDVREIPQLLQAYRIKRVPVVRDGRITGIVSRADLLRSLTPQEPASPNAAHGTAAHGGGFLADAFAELDEHFAHLRHPDKPTPASPRPEPHDAVPEAPEFRHLVADFYRKELQHREEVSRAAAAERQRKVAELIEHHISDENWRTLLHQARQAAEDGQKEFMVLRFPSKLCSDGGRAINVAEPGWPATLRGEAGELYFRWEQSLKSHGFQLAARVLDFPGGKPGDIGLFLTW